MDRSEAKISVVIPTYNRADLIVEAIQSVLNQSLQCEVVVVDDGSTDDTETFLQPFIERGDILYFKQPNQGQATARNLGISQSSGEFICFLDSDNRWLPDKVETQLAYLSEHPEVDILYGDNYTIDAEGKRVSDKNMTRYSGKIYKHLLNDNCVSMNTTMTRRHCFDQLGGFDTTFRVADDYELWLRFSARFNFYHIDKYFAEYRVFGNQISSNKSRRFYSNLRAIEKFHQANPELFTHREWPEILSSFYRRWGYIFSTKDSVKLSAFCYWHALLNEPTKFANWLQFLLMPLRYTKTKSQALSGR